MSDSVKKWYEMQEEKLFSIKADEEIAKQGIGQETVKIQIWQWSIIKEVLYDYLDDYDHREDIRQILIKINEQIL
jgi:hypothetical protein